MVLLGKKIKELRTKYKLTQTELAKHVGVTKSTIAAYENDSRLPSYDVLIKMANVFKVSIDSLLLDRSEVVLHADGLNIEQLRMLETLIAYFRRGNKLESFYAKCTPEIQEQLELYTYNQFNDSKRSE